MQKSFPYRSLLEHIWQDPFLIGILWVASNVEGKAFPYICNYGQQVNLHQSRQLILFPSALLVSVCWCRQPLGVPCGLPSLPYFRTSFVDSYKRKLTVVTVPVSLMALSKTVSFILYISKYYFYPYQLPPTLHSRHFKLTGCGVKFLLVNYLLVQRSSKIIYEWFLEPPAI